MSGSGMTDQEVAGLILRGLIERLRRDAAAEKAKQNRERQELTVILGPGLLDTRGWATRPALLERKGHR